MRGRSQIPAPRLTPGARRSTRPRQDRQSGLRRSARHGADRRGILVHRHGAAATCFAQGQSLPIAAPYDKLFAVLGYEFGGSGANFNTAPSAAIPSAPQQSRSARRAARTVTSDDRRAAGACAPDCRYRPQSQRLPKRPQPRRLPGRAHPQRQPGPAQPRRRHGSSERLFFARGAEPANHVGPHRHPAACGPCRRAAASGPLDTQQPAVGVNPNGTSLSTTQALGSGSAMSIVPSYVAVNFIIRFQ